VLSEMETDIFNHSHFLRPLVLYCKTLFSGLSPIVYRYITKCSHMVLRLYKWKLSSSSTI